MLRLARCDAEQFAALAMNPGRIGYVPSTTVESLSTAHTLRDKAQVILDLLNAGHALGSDLHGSLLIVAPYQPPELNFAVSHDNVGPMNH